jgi:hypothetical protein
VFAGPRPAWEDEDDEGLVVDIASKDRLRKLRRAPDEEGISGTDYQERLRARCVLCVVVSCVGHAWVACMRGGGSRGPWLAQAV